MQTPALAACHSGFDDIHNYCFMGRNPRIGTASDFVFGEQLGFASNFALWNGTSSCIGCCQRQCTCGPLMVHHNVLCAAAFVPAGPLSQLEMFFHAVEQIKLGRERVRTTHKRIHRS